MKFQCDRCKAEADGSHDGYGDANAPKGWIKIQTEPLHVSRVFGSRSGTTFETLCPGCASPEEAWRQWVLNASEDELRCVLGESAFDSLAARGKRAVDAALGRASVPRRSTRRMTLWTGQKINGVAPPPDWVGIRSALDGVLANEGLPGDTIRITVELDTHGRV